MGITFKVASDLLASFPLNGLISDKAYGSMALREELKRNGIKVCIPLKINAKVKYPFDEKLYKKLQWRITFLLI